MQTSSIAHDYDHAKIDENYVKHYPMDMDLNQSYDSVKGKGDATNRSSQIG